MDSNWFKSAKDLLARWKEQETKPREYGGKTLTPRAEKAIGFAVQEAQRLKHNYVGVEHLLLGLVELDYGLTRDAFKRHGLTFSTLRSEIESLVGFGSDRVSWKNVPYAPRARRSLETASKHAKKLGHTYIGSDHILLGLLEEKGGAVGHILDKLKLNPEQMHREILDMMTPKFPGQGDKPKDEG